MVVSERAEIHCVQGTVRSWRFTTNLDRANHFSDSLKFPQVSSDFRRFPQAVELAPPPLRPSTPDQIDEKKRGKAMNGSQRHVVIVAIYDQRKWDRREEFEGHEELQGQLARRR